MAKENDANEMMAIEEEHEPSEHSYWPLVVAVAAVLMGIGFLSSIVVSIVGIVVLMVGLVGWFYEPWVS